MEKIYDISEVSQLTKENLLLLERPVLQEKYSKLMSDTLKVLNNIDWVREALESDRFCFAPWCTTMKPANISGLEAENVGQDGRDLVCHCLVREEGSWISILLHELRHLWQHVVAGQSYDDRLPYAKRPLEIDARAQERLVENIDKEVLRRLDDDARLLDLAMSMAAAGLSIPDEF